MFSFNFYLRVENLLMQQFPKPMDSNFSTTSGNLVHNNTFYDISLFLTTLVLHAKIKQ